MPLMRFASSSASLNTKKERAALSNPPFLLAQQSRPLALSPSPMNSHRLNRPFNDPGQAVKVGGNTTQVNKRRCGPLVTQKLPYFGYVGLLRFDQTNGKIVAHDMEPERGGGSAAICANLNGSWSKYIGHAAEWSHTLTNPTQRLV